MDENDVRSALAVAVRDDDAPPCGISIAQARRRGRRRLRLLRIYLPGAAPVAAAVVVALVITLPAALSSGPSGPRARPGPARASAPTVAPSRFNPLEPYASFGWLPAGFSTTARAGASDESTPASLTLQAVDPVSGGQMVQVTIGAAGACRIGPPPRMPPSLAKPSARALLCTDPVRFVELASAAPDVNGRPAYWTAQIVDGSLVTQGGLVWQYAAGAWAEAEPNPSARFCLHCSPDGLPGWEAAPGGAGQTDPTQPAWPRLAASRALLKIAATMRYGETEPLVFGFRLAGLPAGWQVTADYPFAPLAGRIAATGMWAGPPVDATALGISIGPAVFPASRDACTVIPGQTSSVTVDGSAGVFRYLNFPDDQWQTLCANDIDGVQPHVRMDLNVPGSSAPLPGTGMFSSVLTVFRSVHLLGPDPAAWTTSPMG